MLIENYINLKRKKYEDRLNLNLEVEGVIKKMKIIHILLFTYIENCLKHGRGNAPVHPFVKINLNVTNNEMRFYSKNNNPL